MSHSLRLVLPHLLTAKAFGSRLGGGLKSARHRQHPKRRSATTQPRGKTQAKLAANAARGKGAPGLTGYSLGRHSLTGIVALLLSATAAD